MEAAVLLDVAAIIPEDRRPPPSLLHCVEEETTARAPLRGGGTGELASGLHCVEEGPGS